MIIFYTSEDGEFNPGAAVKESLTIQTETRFEAVSSYVSTLNSLRRNLA